MKVIELTAADADAAVEIINAAASWYATFLAPDVWQPPEMDALQWQEEAGRMRWFGATGGDGLAGVMGLENRLDAALIRHAYVAPARQRLGIGSVLLTHLEAQVDTAMRQIIAGTYARNLPARALFERHGYRLAEDSEAELRKYYRIPEDRLRSSVVLIKRLRQR